MITLNHTNLKSRHLKSRLYVLVHATPVSCLRSSSLSTKMNLSRFPASPDAGLYLSFPSIQHWISKVNFPMQNPIFSPKLPGIKTSSFSTTTILMQFTSALLINGFRRLSSGWVSLAGFSVLEWIEHRKENDLAPERRGRSSYF